jgi:hypothetical protein
MNTNETKQTTVIEGRTYTITETVECKENSAADMIKRGWLPKMFMLVGKRGATLLAFQAANTGAFSIISNLGR